MGLASPPWFHFPAKFSMKCTTFSLYPTSRLLSTSSSSSLLLPISKRCNLVFRRSSSASLRKKTSLIVSCSQLKVEDDTEEACELVSGSEMKLGEGNDTINAHLFKAVKNNNGAGILLLSDIFGFEDSSTRDFAYRVACNGYNVVVPDLFHGNPWSRDQAKALFEQWLAKHDPGRVGKDIATVTKWMADEFTKKLGIVGFCYGGGRVLEVLARDQISTFGTGVSFYGTRMDRSAAPNVKVPVLLLTGDSDPLCPVEIVDEIGKMVGKDSKVVIFKGRGHGFAHRPESPEEDADAEQAFMIMRNWLHDHLLRN